MADRQALILEAAVRVIARNGVRGLRVEELAAEAGVSTALIYYHFKDRAGLIQRTLAFISDRATGYTDEAVENTEDARAVLLQLLLSELQDTRGSVRTASPGASCAPAPSSTPICARRWPSPPAAGTGTPPTPSRTPRRPVSPTWPWPRWTLRSG